MTVCHCSSAAAVIQPEMPNAPLDPIAEVSVPEVPEVPVPEVEDVPLDAIAEVPVPEAAEAAEAEEPAIDAIEAAPLNDIPQKVCEIPQPQTCHIADPDVIRNFRTSLFASPNKHMVLAELMTRHPSTYDQILAQVESTLCELGYVPNSLWDSLNSAMLLLSPEQVVAAGGPIRQNQRIRSLIIDFMRVFSLRQNKGENTTHKQIQRSLQSSKVSTAYYDRRDGMAIDACIFWSCLPRSDFLNLSVEEGIAFLTYLAKNLSAYSPKRCAAILIKLAHIVSTRKNFAMISAFAASPFADALRHVHRVTQSAAEECTAKIV